MTGLLDDLLSDTCTPDNFDMAQVEKVACENGGKCYVSNDKQLLLFQIFILTNEAMCFMCAYILTTCFKSTLFLLSNLEYKVTPRCFDFLNHPNESHIL